MAKRPQLGDVFEVKTSKGLAYIQFSIWNTEWGYLVRVLPGFFDSQPDLESLVSGRECYVAFVTLNLAIRYGEVQFARRCLVPDNAKRLTLFRSGNSGSGRIRSWWLWDGTSSWEVGTLREEQRNLPLKELVTGPALIARLESGWTPATDPK